MIGPLSQPDATLLRFGILVALILVGIGIQMWRHRHERQRVAELRTEMTRELKRYGDTVHELGNAMMREYNGILTLQERQEQSVVEQQRLARAQAELIDGIRVFFEGQREEVTMLREELRTYSERGGTWSRAQIQGHEERIKVLERQMGRVREILLIDEQAGPSAPPQGA